MLLENVNDSFLRSYAQELEKQGIIFTYEVTDREYPNSVKIKIIEIPDSMRGTGEGSKVMKTLNDWADKNNVVLHLVPAGSHKNSAKFLYSWYAHFGYIKNEGKNEIDGLSIMYRLPHNE